MSKADLVRPRWSRALDRSEAPIVIALIAFLAFVLRDGTVQHLEEVYHIPSGQVVFYIMLLNTLGCFIVLLIRSPAILRTAFDPSSKLLWIRGMEGGIGLATGAASLQYITLSESATMRHLRPFPIALLCFVFLGEALSRVQIIAAVISFAAVLLVFQPPILPQIPIAPTVNQHERVIGFALMSVCVLGNAIDFLLMRMIGSAADPILVLLISFIAGTVTGFSIAIVDGSGILPPANLEVWMFIIVAAVFHFIAQIGLVVALQRETGGKIAIIGYIQVVFAVLFQLFFIGIIPSITASLGMGIIIIAGIWSAMKGNVATKTSPEDDSGEYSDSEVQMALLDQREVSPSRERQESVRSV